MSIGLATKGVICTATTSSGVETYPQPVPGCPPDQEADSVGKLHLDVNITEEDIVDITPGIGTTLLPDTPETSEILPTIRNYPLPRNL